MKLLPLLHFAAVSIAAGLVACASQRPTHDLYVEHRVGTPERAQLTENYRDGRPLCEIFTLTGDPGLFTLGSLFRECLK